MVHICPKSPKIYVVGYLEAAFIPSSTNFFSVTSSSDEAPRDYATPQMRRWNGFSLTEDLTSGILSYAILWHTWSPDTDEVTYKDLVDGAGKDKVGYKKLQFCAEQARNNGLEYFWVDTCCIDPNKTLTFDFAGAIYRR